MCEDGEHIEAHKLILSTFSPFFERILKKGKHTHPLIFLKGFKSPDLAAMLDFLYFGEANIAQEKLENFLAIASELELDGLANQNFKDEHTIIKEELETGTHSNKVSKSKLMAINNPVVKVPSEADIPDQSDHMLRGDLQSLDEKVKSLMGKSENMVPNGTQTSGKLKLQRACVCKVCGKEGQWVAIRDHIEANHLEGISLPCNNCGRIFKSRLQLRRHRCENFAQK